LQEFSASESAKSVSEGRQGSTRGLQALDFRGFAARSEV
jgi:hypothetical protein